MKRTCNLDELLTELENISATEKCRTCQCFYDTLLEFREVMDKGKDKDNEQMKQRLSGIIEKSEVTHNCLGCDPCLPVPVSNVLSEIMGTSSLKICSPV